MVTALRDAHAVWLEVVDDGQGMDADTQARIFEPFFSTKFQGRGLGLAATRGIVERHGGALVVESAPGRGARFCVGLPVRAAAGAPQAGGEDEPTWRGAGTVLVVDDEPAVRATTARMLERLGFAAVEASDGDAALDLLRGATPSVGALLLDLSLPGRDGPSTLREVRRLAPRLPVVLMSGVDVGTLQRAADERTPTLLKPFRPADLARALRSALEPAAPSPGEERDPRAPGEA